MILYYWAICAKLLFKLNELFGPLNLFLPINLNNNQIRPIYDTGSNVCYDAMITYE